MESWKQTATTYEQMREAIGDILSGLSTGESNSTAILKKPDVNERLVQCAWHEGCLKKKGLQTVSGKSIEIIQPGRWNEEAGPDFIGAEIKIDGNHVKGDVEIHVNASDWLRHKHDRNFEFNRCILHASLHIDDGQSRDTLFSGVSLERLHLEPHLDPDLDTIRSTLSETDYHYHETVGVGKCAKILEKLEPDFLNRFLDLAGDSRMEEKVHRLARQGAGETDDQVLYQALMTSMGYKGSKTLFFLLSKRVPIEELLEICKNRQGEERIIIMQSILFHVANLIPLEKNTGRCMDEEAITYLNTLNRWWMEYSVYFSDRILPPTKKWFSQVRPANFPTRRIAGMAWLVGRLSSKGGMVDGFLSLFREIAARDTDPQALKLFLRELDQLLTVHEDPFWSRRYNFLSTSKRSLTLIGRNRARSILYNAVFPMMIQRARTDSDPELEKLVKRCAAIYPSLPDNIVTKFMRKRLFGDDRTARRFIFNERRQQALFKIFYDCCNNNEVTCDDCYFFRKTRDQVRDEPR